ncbi:PQQ-dependent dehydrogenase (s-GDH family) [Lutibacter sp. Hel_I_33_5]|uniref:PQQ-dependent sugar dehydrogenase n=1 Tax=Lutibacter sp. Hel_I_33_5 TaxID=1566289 RepID=UPI0011A21D7B|nr:PQQ-dependent sugar dehydrogenase [Lutibacter sp. Hel_I_33_5]TVZ55197.1 PQQ-dependent dehydrogenase (s-GDH family) [Lutibacter sp. Hel_I_33_5]
MKHALLSGILFSVFFSVQSQTFFRFELSTQLASPWEITYGPDNFLWLTESGGKVVRVNPSNGEKQIVYTAPDYFRGDDKEDSPFCNKAIGFGTLGLALDPDFLNSANSYIYYVYSYNSGTTNDPSTKFRIKRLKWDNSSDTVVSNTNIVNDISNGYDHLGGRLLAVKQQNKSYLYLSVGDLGRSEDNNPDCYNPQSTNPNNFTQDVTTQNGKIHRFNMDGTIPSDNPIAGNSFFTRGHRNPQGLMYNPNLDLVYDIEHGDRTDDEINVLQKGMNYGWKDVRGYHDDNSFSGEATYVANYVPNASITNDALVEPLFAWCNTPSTSSYWLDWCTVAPSGGTYYGSNGIPEWNNSLLVVTLKDGVSTDREVYQFKLQANGELVPSTASNPNPKKFFGADQGLNGRLRDVAVSNDGKTIYLINNRGVNRGDKIIGYTYNETTSTEDYNTLPLKVKLFPNPTKNRLKVKGLEKYNELKGFKISNLLGKSIEVKFDSNYDIDVSNFSNGIHFVHLIFKDRTYTLKFIKN